MDDPRFWPFIAVIVVILLVAAHQQWSNRMADRLEELEGPERTVTVVLALLLWPIMMIAAGWVDMVLWNMLAEKYGLPTLDLFSAIILGVLVGSLIWTTGGMRRVWVANKRSPID